MQMAPSPSNTALVQMRPGPVQTQGRASASLVQKGPPCKCHRPCANTALVQTSPVPVQRQPQRRCDPALCKHGAGANAPAAKHSPGAGVTRPRASTTPVSPCQCDIATRPRANTTLPRAPPGPQRDPAGLGATLAGAPLSLPTPQHPRWGGCLGRVGGAPGRGRNVLNVGGQTGWGGRLGLGGHRSQTGETGTGAADDGGRRGGQVLGCPGGGGQVLWGAGGVKL